MKKLILSINQHSYFPKYSKWIFIGLLFSLSLLYNYHNILFKPSQSIHKWRQADCLSITQNYYQDNNPFLEPSVHNLGLDGTGKTISECPIIYYSVAQLWKVFGKKEFIYRLLIVLLFFVSLFLTFKLFEERLKDSILSMIGALFLFTSPTLVYYANNFLMDVPALSFALMGLYYFFKFEESGKNKDFYWSSFFYMIGGLLKISSLLSFVVIISLFGLELIKVKFIKEGVIFKNPLKQGLTILTVLVIQFIWYSYAKHYNEQFNGGNFLIGILPIWEVSSNEIWETLYDIVIKSVWDYLLIGTQITLLLMFVFVLIFSRKLNRVHTYFMLITSIGFLSFIILFFGALRVHDYYTINLFILTPIILLSFFILLKGRYPKLFNSFILKLLLLTLFLFNVRFAKRKIYHAYEPNGWKNEYYINYLSKLSSIPEYLLSIGVKDEDKIICLPDNSINISLYSINHKGWTNYGTNFDSTTINQNIKLGAKYLIIFDSTAYSQPTLSPFISNKVGTHNGIDVYKL